MKIESDDPKVIGGCIVVLLLLAGIGGYVVGDFIIARVPANALLGGGVLLGTVGLALACWNAQQHGK